MRISRFLRRIFYKVLLFKSRNPRKVPYIYAKMLGFNIGKDCEIHGKVFFGSEPQLIDIGDNVRITDNVRFITHDGGIWVLRNLYTELKKADIIERIKIGNNVHIGINTIILPGVTIGDNCIIGVGSIVTKSIPSNSVAAGVPCKVIRTITQYKEKNMDRISFVKK